MFQLGNLHEGWLLALAQEAFEIGISKTSLGGAAHIRDAFIGFQRHLFKQRRIASPLELVVRELRGFR